MKVNAETGATSTKDETLTSCSVLQALSAAVALRPPLLVFPVVSLQTFESIPDVGSVARDPTLPSEGAVRAIVNGGGNAPTGHSVHASTSSNTLRSFLMMKV